LGPQHRNCGSGFGSEGRPQFFGAASEVLAEGEHGVDPFLAPKPAPRTAIKRAAGGKDGRLHLLKRQGLDLSDDLFGVGVFDCEGLALARDESPVDV
jgi:hypothetical protein